MSWVAVLGFATLALLWPLLRLTGLEAMLGGALTVLVVFGTTLVVWVLGAGLGAVPRPVLTLTLSGAVFSLLLTASFLVLGDGPAHGWARSVVAATIELAQYAGLGAVAGLAAAAIQRRGGPQR
ncbi:MAG TPA: hypothetical protein GXZ60_05175 [Intrasporangiaceae bacterium]|nr:hypothetical protein [Intrasporangiaceae bacterium]